MTKPPRRHVVNLCQPENRGVFYDLDKKRKFLQVEDCVCQLRFSFLLDVPMETDDLKKIVTILEKRLWGDPDAAASIQLSRFHLCRQFNCNGWQKLIIPLPGVI